MEIDFQFIVDGAPSKGLERTFERHWPSYQRWIRKSNTADNTYCVHQLERHMPELRDTHLNLTNRFGATEEISRFLTLFDPPRVIRACTQLILDTDRGPVLLRSYDHHPRLFDGIVLRSCWGATPTLAVTDCLWGALDGINEHGLAIALAFGGRNVIGSGFAAPLICRYVLETCSSVSEAKSALQRLPVYMPYTFVVVDAAGDFVTAFLGPDREPSFVKRRASANHQGAVEWPEYARFSNSQNRLEQAESLTGDRKNITEARRSFLAPPLWCSDYATASATLYVAEYAPSTRSLDLRWPGYSERLSLSDSHEHAFTVSLPAQVLR